MTLKKRRPGAWGRPKDSRPQHSLRSISNAIVGSNQSYLKNEFSEPFHRLPKSGEDLFTFLNTEFVDPIKGIEGFLCPGIDILGNVYNIATLFGASD